MSEAVAEAEVVEGTLGELLAEFVEQSKRLADAESEVKAIKARMAAIEPTLLEEMGGAGMDSARVADRTVYVRHDLFVNKHQDIAGEQIVETLRTIGLGHLVKEDYSPSALKSQVREWRESGEPIPMALDGLVKVTEVPRAICRR